MQLQPEDSKANQVGWVKIMLKYNKKLVIIEKIK